MRKAVERRSIVDLDRLMRLASTDVSARLALAREARRSGRAELVCLDWLSGSSGRGVARPGGWWLEIASWPVFVGKDRLPSREIRAQFTCYNQSARPVSLCWRKLQPAPDQVVGVDGRRHLAE
jgi:hypothetical protein